MYSLLLCGIAMFSDLKLLMISVAILVVSRIALNTSELQPESITNSYVVRNMFSVVSWRGFPVWLPGYLCGLKHSLAGSLMGFVTLFILFKKNYPFTGSQHIFDTTCFSSIVNVPPPPGKKSKGNPYIRIHFRIVFRYFPSWFFKHFPMV